MKTLFTLFLTLLFSITYSQTFLDILKGEDKVKTKYKIMFGLNVVQHGTNIGRPIYRSNAISSQSWGQIGCKAYDWSAENDSVGFVTYNFYQDYSNTIDTFKLWYSKKSDPCKVSISIDKNDLTNITLISTGDWNRFKPITFVAKVTTTGYHFVTFKFKPQQWGNFEISHIEFIQIIPNEKRK